MASASHRCQRRTGTEAWNDLEEATGMCGVCDEEPSPSHECGICLSSVTELFNLPCSHDYCSDCMAEYIARKMELRESRGRRAEIPSQRASSEWISACKCPTCSKPLGASTMEMLVQAMPSRSRSLYAAALARGREYTPANTDAEAQAGVTTRPTPASARSADVAFRGWARARHLKFCPSCSSPIEKNGGCENMKCSVCKTSFRWDRVPLAVPCTGYHYTNAPPFVRRCPHVRIEAMPLKHRAAYVAQKGCIMAPAALLVVPILLVAAPIAIADAVRTAARKRSERHRKRQAAEAQRARSAEFLAESQRQVAQIVACRQTGEHTWVAGWCYSCGAIDGAAVGDAATVVAL